MIEESLKRYHLDQHVALESCSFTCATIGHVSWWVFRDSRTDPSLENIRQNRYLHENTQQWFGSSNACPDGICKALRKANVFSPNVITLIIQGGFKIERISISLQQQPHHLQTGRRDWQKMGCEWTVAQEFS